MLLILPNIRIGIQNCSLLQLSIFINNGVVSLTKEHARLWCTKKVCVCVRSVQDTHLRWDAKVRKMISPTPIDCCIRGYWLTTNKTAVFIYARRKSSTDLDRKWGRWVVAPTSQARVIGGKPAVSTSLSRWHAGLLIDWWTWTETDDGLCKKILPTKKWMKLMWSNRTPAGNIPCGVTGTIQISITILCTNGISGGNIFTQL